MINDNNYNTDNNYKFQQSLFINDTNDEKDYTNTMNT